MALGCTDKGSENGLEDKSGPTTSSVVTSTSTPAQSSSNNVVEISLEDPGGSGEYVYMPASLSFEEGETVTFALTSEEEFHTFTVEDLGIDVEVDAGETVQYTFTFDSPGEYQLVCIPHESLGMVGTIVVN